MYTRGRVPHRGRVVSFNPGRMPVDQEDDDAISIPSPDIPEDADEEENSMESENEALSEERNLGENSAVSGGKPLFRFLNTDIWLDDIIILVLIIVLITENRDDSLVLPALVFLFIAGLGVI